MRWPSRRRFLLADLAVLALVAVVVVVLSLLSSRAGGSSSPSTEVTVSGQPLGQAIPPGFLGLSLEYSAVPAYAGDDPRAPNGLFVRLIKNLAPSQSPVLRIGGDSADWTWWPVTGLERPPGVTFTLTTRWMAIARGLAQALNAKLILGLNLEANSATVAGAEAAALLHGIGAHSVEAFELGNEAELYSSFPWYRTRAGRAVHGRPPGYGFTDFTSDFTRVAAALPDTPLAGPTLSGTSWLRRLVEFLAREPRVRLVTLHRYPLQLCFTARDSVHYPTVANLLAPRASTGLADGFAPYVAIARAHALALRVDELNTVSCGADRRVSDTFAAALWVLDTLFELARVGVAGVNVHTFPGAGYELFRFERVRGRWRAQVAPEYYGLLMFAQAVAPGSRLLRVSGAANRELKVWAVRAPDHALRVLVINKDAAHARRVALRLAGATGAARLERLEAPSLSAHGGVTLGGRSFGPATSTGALAERPRSSDVRAARGRYTFEMPAASAALLSVGA